MPHGRSRSRTRISTTTGRELARIARAFITALQRGRVQGTSTLTQRLVKNAILTDARTPDRKMREIILALQPERTTTKDQILRDVPERDPVRFHGVRHRIGGADLLRKGIKDLALDEAALLAALPQSPSRYSPYGSSLHGDNRDTPSAASTTFSTRWRSRAT